MLARRTFLLGIAAALLAALPVLSDGDFDAKLRHWQNLTKEEQTKLRERYKAWKGLPEPVRKDLMRRYREMPPERRQKLADRLKQLQKGAHKDLIQKLRSLPPERRAQFREVFKVLRSLPPEERERLRQLPPQDRREQVRSLVADRLSAEYAATLNDAERPRFDALPSEEKKGKVREWLRQRAGRPQR